MVRPGTRPISKGGGIGGYQNLTKDPFLVFLVVVQRRQKNADRPCACLGIPLHTPLLQSQLELIRPARGACDVDHVVRLGVARVLQRRQLQSLDRVCDVDLLGRVVEAQSQ